MINLLPFNFLIKSSNFSGLIICFLDNFLFLIIFEAFSFCVIKNSPLSFPIIKRQFGIGLFGLSDPRIFRVQAAFSGALTNK